jgi:hypothetical protein
MHRGLTRLSVNRYAGAAISGEIGNRHCPLTDEYRGAAEWIAAKGAIRENISSIETIPHGLRYHRPVVWHVMVVCMGKETRKSFGLNHGLKRPM